MVSPNKCASSTPYRTPMKGMMKLCYVFLSCSASLPPVQPDAGNVGVKGYMSQVLRIFKIKGFPRVGPFLNAFPPWGSDPGCGGESPLTQAGDHGWAWTLGMANPSCEYPRALVLLSYPEAGLVMVGLMIFFSFLLNLPIIFFCSSPEFCLVLNPSRWKTRLQMKVTLIQSLKTTRLQKRLRWE